MKRTVVILIIVVLLPFSTIYASDECETYALLTIDTPNFADAELDIQEMSCSIVHVLNEEGDIVDVFVFLSLTADIFMFVTNGADGICGVHVMCGTGRKNSLDAGCADRLYGDSAGPACGGRGHQPSG